MWTVDVIAYDDGAVVKTLGPFPTERMADRADDGLNRNLDHAAYYTQIRHEPTGNVGTHGNHVGTHKK